MEKFIERLRELRIERGLTQTQIAQSTGLSQPALANWEKGKRIPNAVAIIKLAKFFNVSADYLLGLTDEE